MMSRITLLHLPVELLCHTLVFLGDATYDLVRVRETCKTLKALIDNSEMLQYIIDLCYFQMVHVGAHETVLPMAMYRRQLRQQEDALRTFMYKKYTLEHISNIDIVGGMYATLEFKEDYTRFKFVRLSPVSDPDDVHSWNHSVAVAVEHYRGLAFCPEQDLIAIATSSPENENYVFDIHLRSLKTNEIHPKATKSILKAFELNPEHIFGDPVVFRTPSDPKNFRICGSYISMQCEDKHPLELRNGIQMLDWKNEKGYGFIISFDDPSTDYTFISEDRFLILLGSEGVLELYSIADKSQPPQCTARFYLPSLLDGCEYEEGYINVNPILGPGSPEVQKSPHKSCFFHPTDDRLIIFQIFVSGGSFFFFVRPGAILQAESLASRDDGDIPWSAWGPQHTTWFAGEFTSQLLYGFRTVGFINNGLPGPRHLYIRDFNPHNTCSRGTVDITRLQGLPLHGNLITARIYGMFAEPLGCALRYREVVSRERFEAVEAILDQNRIFLLRGDGSKKIDMLVF